MREAENVKNSAMDVVRIIAAWFGVFFVIMGVCDDWRWSGLMIFAGVILIMFAAAEGEHA